MINEFLQFLKKQQFVNKFARADLLFLLRPLQTFKSQMFLARLAAHPSGLRPSERIRRELSLEQNRLPAIFAPALALNAGICPPVQTPPALPAAGSIRIRSALDEKERRFSTDLVRELIAEDFVDFELPDWLQTLDLNYDMRLFGSELERLQTSSLGRKEALPLTVDWIRTSREELWLELPAAVSLQSELPLSAQRQMAKLYFYLLFAKGIYPADWRWVAADSQNRIAWVDFSAVFSADPPLQDFARRWLHGGTQAQTAAQKKIERSLRLLKIWCPDLNLAEFAVLKHSLPETTDAEPALSLELLSRNGFPSANAAVPDSVDPEQLVYLLDSDRHRRNPLFRKSSFFYWGPLLIAILVLYYFF